MKHRTLARGRAILGGVTLTVAVIGGASAAEAAVRVPELPATATPCPLDTAPNSPSCIVDTRLTTVPGTTPIVINPDWVCYQSSIGTIYCKPILTWCTDDGEVCGSTG